MSVFRASGAAALAAATALSGAWLGVVTAQPVPPAAPSQATPAPTAVAVGGKIQAENACYVRLPDMPVTVNGSGRYGMFGAYNPVSGVLVGAGGAFKASDENTIAYHDMYAVRLDSPAAKWREIGYSTSTGYTQDTDKGCREMAAVQLSATNWASVFGKDGCDNGRFDTGSKKGGDIREISVGASASSSGVRWVANSGAGELIGELKDNKGKLARLFAVWDDTRNRIVFGQGTFDDERDQLTEDSIYEAKKVGSQFQLTELRPTGRIPLRRYGTCAAYVYDKDAGLDGALVLGGQEGAPEGASATSHKEVWWLDFSKNKNGEWSNITSRVENMDAIGFRREGACAYDPGTKAFYSWMGRADAKIPDGASHSAGAWRVSLAPLAESGAPMTWERLAKDKTAGIKGRRLIPSVWDPIHKRMLVLGGRNGLEAYTDVWAIYPDVTGAACEALDPFAPFQSVATPTSVTGPTPTLGGPTPVDTPMPPPRPTVAPGACPSLTNLVPAAVINAALSNPASVQGYNELQNPGVPASPWNVRRTSLSLRNPAIPFHPLYNGLVYKAGCP